MFRSIHDTKNFFLLNYRKILDKFLVHVLFTQVFLDTSRRSSTRSRNKYHSACLHDMAHLTISTSFDCGVDWMALYASNQNLKVYFLTGEANPFCFLRVPDAAHSSLPLTARQTMAETHIVRIFFSHIHFISLFTLFKRLRQRFPSVVPMGTLLVLRTHPDSTTDPTAISVLTLEPITWRDGQELCLVAHRGLRAHYTITSSSLNTQRAPLPLRVSVMLLLLEHDWIIVRHLHFFLSTGALVLSSVLRSHSRMFGILPRFINSDMHLIWFMTFLCK